jgi:hypothetical protein
LFRIQHVDFGNAANSTAPKAFGAGCAIIPNLPMIARERTPPAVRTRTLFARTRFVNI